MIGPPNPIRPLPELWYAGLRWVMMESRQSGFRRKRVELMKTIAIERYGTAAEFRAIEMSQPVPRVNEVLVAIHAFSINPMDIAARQGKLGAPFDVQWHFPLNLGWDFAGIVAAVGPKVTTFQRGDAVFGAVPVTHAANNGTYGEYVAADLKQVAHLPAGLSFEEAAALPVSGLAAYDGIRHRLHVQPGEKVLVQGGAGGVGLYAVQLARLAGAYVATTASQAHVALLKSLGADEVIDYQRVDPAAVLSGVDAVFDTVGDVRTGLLVLQPTGRLVTIAGHVTAALKGDHQKSVSFQATTGTGADLAELGHLVVTGQIKQRLTVLPVSVANVMLAHRQIEGHHTTGKLVMRVKD